jgi:hypothetical protein
MGTIEDLRQFWIRQLAITVASLLLFLVFLWLAWPELQVLPRDALEAIFTASATLLGLTFTAFSILATFIPGLRRDFVKSRTFSTMGQTFVLTMVAELLTLILSGLSFLAAGRPGVEYAALGAVLFAFLSVGFLAQLGAYMFSLFKMARSET